jgi:hypothetical protein
MYSLNLALWYAACVPVGARVNGGNFFLIVDSGSRGCLFIKQRLGSFT